MLLTVQIQVQNYHNAILSITYFFKNHKLFIIWGRGKNKFYFSPKGKSILNVI